jgi:hypothetical protein
MFEIIRLDMFVEFAKMDHKHRLRGYDWTQEFVRSPQVKMSLMDRVLTFTGDTLIWVGNKLKQRSQDRLPAEQAQAPTFMIML